MKWVSARNGVREEMLDTAVRLLAEEEDDESAWLKSAASNPAFDFLEDEDIYTLADGMRFDDTL